MLFRWLEQPVQNRNFLYLETCQKNMTSRNLGTKFLSFFFFQKISPDKF